MPQNRPYFNYSFKQLEEEFDNNQNNQEVLEKIANELSFRKSKKAVLLKDKITNTIIAAFPNITKHKRAEEKNIETNKTPEFIENDASQQIFEKLELNKILQRSLTNKTTDILSAWGALEILSPVTFNKKEDLLKVYDNVKDVLSLRTVEKDVSEKYHISVCGGTGCTSSNSLEIVEALHHWAKECGVEDKVEISITGCFGFCERGPIVKVFPDHTFYTKVKVSDAEKIIKDHIVNHEVVHSLLYKDSNGNTVNKQDNINFYQKQHRIALRNCGLINPEIIAETIAAKGYQALAKALFEMTPDQVIDEVIKSGLRGRGGAGFPTGQKWKFAKASVANKKYIICNADEGDPGAFMDRSILEGDPHSVLESMAIAGYAIGADEGEIYIRAEYPLAVHRLEIAIKQATEMGLLGKNIMGTDFSFNINIKYGAGAFVCGEETALIHSIEGNRGEPTLKPPFPAVKGLFGKPTNVNNVETWANIPVIILDGGEEFAKIGTERSKGTKVFALAGKINNVGLVEVPMGTTLREIIYDKNQRKIQSKMLRY